MYVVYGMTRNLYEKIIPSLTSLLEHNEVEKIFILCEDDYVPNLPKQCEFINVKDQKVFSPSSPNFQREFTYMVLMRATYPSLLPLDKVISLDVDTIVCDSLLPIWEKDLTGKWFAAVPEHNGLWRPFGGIYYNIGVCVYNLKQMREDNIEPKLVNLLNTRKLQWLEQDALNYYGICERKISTLPVRYNECGATGKTDNPAVVHYAGIINWWDRGLPRGEYLDKYRGAT